MSTNALHPQTLDFLGVNDDTFIAFRAECNASVTEPAREDGLFEYLEGLDGVPGSQTHGPGTGTDVVQYCIDLAEDMLDLSGTDESSGATGVTSKGGLATGDGAGDGADSTGGSGGGKRSPRIPCGPFASP